MLRPGGRLVVADWGAPAGLVPRLVFPTLRVLDGAAGLEDHAAGRLPEFIRCARFEGVTATCGCRRSGERSRC